MLNHPLIQRFAINRERLPSGISELLKKKKIHCSLSLILPLSNGGANGDCPVPATPWYVEYAESRKLVFSIFRTIFGL